MIGPSQGSLGWYLLRIDAIANTPARSLAQAHGDIAAKLIADKKRAGLSDLTARIDDRLGQGYALSDAARDVGAVLQSTPPITADGEVLGGPAPATLPKELLPLVKTAFAMDHAGQPQLAEVDPGKSYVMFDVSQITPAAAPPLAQIKAQVAAAMALEQGAQNARTAGLKVIQAVRHGSDLAAALSGLGVKLPAPLPVTLTRQQVAAMGDKVPAPVSLLFAMAPGTVKLLAQPRDQGWAVVQLKQAGSDPVAAGDPLLASAATELGQMTGNEYAEEMGAAIRAEAGVTRNPVAIRAVARQVLGGS